MTYCKCGKHIPTYPGVIYKNDNGLQMVCEECYLKSRNICSKTGNPCNEDCNGEYSSGDCPYLEEDREAKPSRTKNYSEEV